MSRGTTVLVVHGHRAGHGRGGTKLISAECVARLSVAEQAALKHGVQDVLLSGSRVPGFRSEAGQMADLWSGPAVRLWLDEMSTDSTENEASLRWAQELGASELIVVSSWWHLRLPLSCRGARGLGIKVRWKSSKRMSGLSGHLRRELRYLPRALRHGTNRSTRSARPVGPVDEQQIASRLLQLQRQAELGVLRGGRGHRARPV